MLMPTKLLTALLVSSALLGLTFILCKKFAVDVEKSSPYECGFDSFKSARAPFSSRFFFLAILFVVFDVEIALLVPTLNYNGLVLEKSLVVWGFLLLLVIGLFHEWRQGSLTWK